MAQPRLHYAATLADDSACGKLAERSTSVRDQVTCKPCLVELAKASRPLTSKLSPAIVSLALFYAPAHAEDHLVHAWSALEAAARGEKVELNRAFAANRLACAQSEPVSRAVKPRDRKAFETEVAELAAALG